MSKIDFQQLIGSDQPVIVDGGMATALYEKGFYINRSFEELSMTESQVVREVTQSFKQAGAQILGTNTFGAVHPKLVKYGLQDRLESILTSATEIAKEVAGEDALVAGTIGPLGLLLEPLGPTSFDDAKNFFGRNVKCFEESGADCISLVGFHDLKELEAAVQAVREYSKLPVMLHMAIQESMKSSYGHSIPELVALGEKYDVEVIGFSGEVGPSGMLTAVGKLRPLTKRKISLLPNAGLPRYVNDEYIYLCNPDYIGKFAKRFVQAGANLVGGHSGVHADHIKAIANSVRMTQSLNVELSDSTIPAHLQPIVDEPKKEVDMEERSRLGKALCSPDEQVVSVEIIPPKGIDFENFKSHCEELVAAKVKFVNIPDGARAMARMSSLHMAAYVNRHFDLEPIPHFTSRDRNLIGIQSDLLGCYMNGIRNVLLVTGDPPKLGNCPGATAVYDVDAIGMTHIVSRMNQGLDLGGTTFGQPTQFMIGVALNPTATHRELEIKRYRYKIEAGAQYAITQPIYDVEAYAEFMEKAGADSIPVIMGIWPLVSLRNAEFLKNEVPGVSVPDWVISEMEKAGDNKEEAVKRGMEIAVKTMEQASKMVKGFQVSAPFNRVKVAVDAIHGALGKS
ncbi:MAG: bifunctional homocysteine S-methyltransferase/methylenetetrahydrofolate reductase [Bdellovibrionaceae bacterium]|nr:bifunctional homocysteine S-methyltransferase/methylenetetrahydrofolate reductase [Pseudobdellovibrionaceae bacterium]